VLHALLQQVNGNQGSEPADMTRYDSGTGANILQGISRPPRMKLANISGVTICIEALRRLPGAARVSSDVVASLLQAALALPDWHSATTCMRVLCYFSGARGMSGQQMVQLLMAGFKQIKVDATKYLSKLPAFGRLSGVNLAQALLAAAERGDSRTVLQLCSLQGAKVLDAAVVLPALQAVVKHGYCNCIQALCKLPAAQQISGDAVTGLLQAAVECSSRTGYRLSQLLQDLSKLSAVRQLGNKAIAELLRAAVLQHGGRYEYQVSGRKLVLKLMLRLPYGRRDEVACTFQVAEDMSDTDTSDEDFTMLLRGLKLQS
jgi:hypothetical protein